MIRSLIGIVVLASGAPADAQWLNYPTPGVPRTAPEPTWNGYSVGRWEDGALVVETVGLRDGTWLDRLGNPLTDAARITERYRRVSFGRLEIEVTIDDPKAYTRPWTVTLTHLLMPDTELLDYHCTDYDAEVVEQSGDGSGGEPR